MQFLIDTVPHDIALMFVTYLVFCLVLMYLFIRADCQWNKREMKRSNDRMRRFSTDHEKNERLRELTTCSIHHDVNCSCFLHGKDSEVMPRNTDSGADK